MPSLQSKGVIQAVKAVCAYMGNIESNDITEALEGFKSACLQFIPIGPLVSENNVNYIICQGCEQCLLGSFFGKL